MARKKLRGESDMCSFSIYISKDERDRIQREADELDVSRNGRIRSILAEHLNEKK